MCAVKGVGFHKKSRQPLGAAKIQNEVRMRITKHDGSKRTAKEADIPVAYQAIQLPQKFYRS